MCQREQLRQLAARQIGGFTSQRMDGRTQFARLLQCPHSAINHLFFMRCTITLQGNWADLRMGRGGPCLS